MEFYLWDLFVGRLQKNNTYRPQNYSRQLKLLFSLKKTWIRGTQEMFLEINVWRYSEVWNLARQTIILLFLFHFKKMSHLSCVLLISTDDSKSAVTEYWLNKDWNYIVSVFVLGSPFEYLKYLRQLEYHIWTAEPVIMVNLRSSGFSENFQTFIQTVTDYVVPVLILVDYVFQNSKWPPQQ